MHIVILDIYKIVVILTSKTIEKTGNSDKHGYVPYWKRKELEEQKKNTPKSMIDLSSVTNEKTRDSAA